MTHAAFVEESVGVRVAVVAEAGTPFRVCHQDRCAGGPTHAKLDVAADEHAEVDDQASFALARAVERCHAAFGEQALGVGYRIGGTVDRYRLRPGVPAGNRLHLGTPAGLRPDRLAGQHLDTWVRIHTAVGVRLRYGRMGKHAGGQRHDGGGRHGQLGPAILGGRGTAGQIGAHSCIEPCEDSPLP